MATNALKQSTFDRPLKIGDGVYWVGTHDPEACRTSNAFLIRDGDEAVLLDGGIREDLTSLVLKVLQLGVQPRNILALVYHNRSPQVWETRHHLQRLIDRPDLQIITDLSGIRRLSSEEAAGPFASIEAMGHHFKFSSGRRLQFFKIPFAPAAGSFVTFDLESAVLFTGELFGSQEVPRLFWGELEFDCQPCLEAGGACVGFEGFCPVHSMEQYHRSVMPSEKALRSALQCIAALPFRVVAPQYGGILAHPESIAFLWRRLSLLTGVGIDGLPVDGDYGSFGSEKLLNGNSSSGKGQEGDSCLGPESCFADWEA